MPELNRQRWVASCVQATDFFRRSPAFSKNGLGNKPEARGDAGTISQDALERL
jgi:hypothetical protein